MDHPESLPQYTWEKLLQIASLATTAMLREDRLQPAADGKPVGCYWNGYTYIDLYERAAAVPMPSMSPGRQRAYDARRTCATCGKRSTRPWLRGPVGDVRYCPVCIEGAWRHQWDLDQAARRAAAAQWACEVLADPEAVLLADVRQPNDWGHHAALRAETLDGQVLLDVTRRICRHDPCYPCSHSDDVPPGALMLDEAVHAVRRALAPDRRPVIWWPPAVGQFAELISPLGKPYTYGDVWRDWVGQRDANAEAPYRLYRRLAIPPTPRAAVEQIAAMRAGLAEMAGSAS